MSLYRGATPARVYVGAALARFVYRGATIVWQRDPADVIVTASGTVPVPTWAAFADVICLGGGGGGQGGNGGNGVAGTGGKKGAYVSDTIAVTPGQVLTVTIGAAGTGGPLTGTTDRTGTDGGATSVTVPGGPTLTAPGGAKGTGFTATVGESPGSHTRATLTVTGGTGGARNAAATDPGAGGGPGDGGIFNGGNAGKNGSRGQVWVRFRSY